jgi:predicted DNA-binding transcriptional regulator AlpA
MSTALASGPCVPKLLLDIQEVSQAVGLAESTLWRWISAGKFPPATRSVGHKVRLWRTATIEAWADGTWAGEGK